jgi:hypothetical protein
MLSHLDASRLSRFQREAEVLASLNHPNIGRHTGGTDLPLCFAKNPSAVTSVEGRTQSSKYVASGLAFVFVIDLGLFDFSF